MVCVPRVLCCPDGIWWDGLELEEQCFFGVRLADARLAQSLEINCPARFSILLGGNEHGHAPLGGVVHKRSLECPHQDNYIQPLFHFCCQCTGPGLD